MKELCTFHTETKPSINGFTPSNIWRMKQFFETYKENEKLATLGREIPWSHSLSPPVIAEYETKLIPKELLRKKLNEFYALLEGGE